MAFVAGGTLLAEVALTRVFSVSLYHHFAFLVVSTALLGTGVAGAFVSGSARIRAYDADDVAAAGALILAAGLPICFTLVQLVGLEPLELATSASASFELIAVYVLMALPFFGGGLAIAVTLDRHADDAARLYAADLAGAGVGAFLTLGALGLVGGIGAVLTGGVLAAVGAFCFATGRLGKVGLGTAVVLAGLVFADVLPLHITKSKVTRAGEPFSKVLANPEATPFTAWNSMARVDHVIFAPGVERLMIDAGVAAVRIPIGKKPQPTDATLPYELTEKPRVLIIGAGAGWEVQEALAFGASKVDAVEVNDLVAAFTPKYLTNRKELTLIVDEARSYVEGDVGPYDAIVMIHTISNAATAAGAMHLAEDYLLTREAIATMVSRLSDRGVLFITRPEAQIPRLLATIDRNLPVYVWAERSIGPSFYGAILVAKQPLSPANHQRIIDRIASRGGLRLHVQPNEPPANPLLAGIVSGKDPAWLERKARVRLDPATDDRPFFHQRRRFSELEAADFAATLGIEKGARLALEDRPFAEIAAVLLLVETTIVGAIALLLPFLFRRRRGGDTVPVGRALSTFAYFAAIGLGFMLVEIVLVQRLALLLGAPARCFATVFAGLLIGAGIGSRFSEKLRQPTRAPILAVGAGVVLTLVLPAVVGAFAGASEVARIGISLAVVLPTGFVLGMPFPSGLSLIKDADGLVAWAFATNGMSSIAGTVLAVIASSIFGFTAVLGAGAAIYAIAALAGPRMRC